MYLELNCSDQKGNLQQIVQASISLWNLRSRYCLRLADHKSLNHVLIGYKDTKKCCLTEETPTIVEICHIRVEAEKGSDVNLLH